jgi:hypothetical protein
MGQASQYRVHSMKISHWVLPFAALGSAVAFGAILTPPGIPEQPLIRGIYNWGDVVAVVADNYDSANHTVRYSLGVVDDRAGRIVPFRELKCGSYDDIGYSEELGKVLVCGDGRVSRIYRLLDGSWKPVSEALPGGDFRVAVDHERIAAVADDTLFLISGLSRRTLLSAHFKVGTSHRAPSALVLQGREVVLGYDSGEFGGGLYRLELDSPSHSVTLLKSGNMRALNATPSGEIWVADGLAHMTIERAALYRLNGNRLETVASISGSMMSGYEWKVLEKSGIPFPGVTDISGLTLDRTDRPVVAFPEFGVFELVEGKFVGLIETPMEFSYSMPGYNVTSRPQGLVIGRSGDIYIATRSLGVLIFRKSDGRYDSKPEAVRQVLF